MKRIVFGIVALLLTASVGYCQESKQALPQLDQDSPLTLTITSEKQVYEVEEPINLKLELKNIGNRDITIQGDFIWEEAISFFITKKEPPIAHIIPLQINPPLTKGDSIILKPNENFTKEVNVLNWMKESILQPGVYDMRSSFGFAAVLGNLIEDVMEIWTDASVTSNTITLEVVEKK